MVPILFYSPPAYIILPLQNTLEPRLDISVRPIVIVKVMLRVEIKHMNQAIIVTKDKL